MGHHGVNTKGRKAVEETAGCPPKDKPTCCGKTNEAETCRYKSSEMIMIHNDVCI